MSQRPSSEDPAAPIGVLFVNLGTPDSPSVRDVRRYLRQFLSDRRVVDTPRLLWWPLLNGIILPIRAKKSAHAYAQVWTSEGSPLLAISRKQAASLARELGASHRVELAMRYGNPSIEAGLRALAAAGCARIRVLTAFPQYSDSTVGSVVAEVARVASVLGWPPPEPDDRRADEGGADEGLASGGRDVGSRPEGERSRAVLGADREGSEDAAGSRADSRAGSLADSRASSGADSRAASAAASRAGSRANSRDGSRTDALATEARRPRVDIVAPWFDDDGYVRALAETCRAHERERTRARPGATPIRHWVFSFHGLPQRYVDRGDPYRRHCEATARALAAAMGLAPTQWTTTFQSRFGPEAWLEPYTDVRVPELVAEHGCVAVAMPGFLADCLETIEEIGIRLVEDCRGQGEVVVVPCVNDHAELARGLARLVE